MGCRIMEKEKADNLIEIEVFTKGDVDGVYECYGRFDTSHEFTTCNFHPDDGWYRIATYSASEILAFEQRGVNVTFDYDWLEEEVRSNPKANWMYHEAKNRP